MVFQSLEFHKDKAMKREEMLNSLIEFGFSRAERVNERGDFSLRGNILDVYPFTFDEPVRVEFDGDRVESVCSVDLVTFARLEFHTSVVILPRPKGAPHIPAIRGKARLAQIRAYEGEAPLGAFLDLEPGDYVVHVQHGIGRFRGRVSIAVKDSGGRAAGRREKLDHLKIEYADGDILYVPSTEVHLVARYIAFLGRRPRLSKLGTKRWQKLKDQTRRGIKTLASDLLRMQAARSSLHGFAFSKDTDWQKMLEASFPYKETPGQTKATEETKRDMEFSHPMDRLLCGDVGYGKTEVALRAAFKAVMDNKQAAMLVPTTILAEQHLYTFRQRMEDFPVRIEMLSRFVSEGEERSIINGLRDGTVDIVIGTHRLLSDDVSFRDLGLVIIDEEQRFGVKDKEKLKGLRLLVDVLTLTATPIPRTLYMSLMGARDMSIIDTPPSDRLPVETVVCESDDSIIRDAVRRELARVGQVYFINNRIHGIINIAEHIKALVPEARVACAHGRMPSRALERVMRQFIQGEVDVLVSTTIVESGIDIPNANTLLVNRADRFGLADLYQLRGRVGRFTRKAYTYFLVPSGMKMDSSQGEFAPQETSGHERSLVGFILSGDASRRLGSIQRYTELGSGFKIALEDLEIRGAGNLLGAEQHGYIMSVGFDLYCRLLRDLIREMGVRGDARI